MAYMKDSTGRRLDSFRVREYLPVMDTAVLGDSIDADSTGWWPTACGLTEQRMRLLYNGGVGGDTTAMALARIANVIYQAPKVCIIGGGVTNDIAQGVAAATTKANLTSMVTQLRAAGITPLFRNCPPRGAAVAPYDTDALAIEAVNAHNTWLAGYAASEGIELFDIYTPLVDPTTSLIKAALTNDGIHPNLTGALVVGRAFRDNLPNVFKNAEPFPLNTRNTFTRIQNPLFITHTSGVATNWANGSGFTTKDINTPAPAGNWQHFAKTDSAWALATQTPGIPGGTPITIGYRISVAAGLGVISYRFKDAAGTAIGNWVSSTHKVLSTTADGLVHIIRALAPANAASMDLYIENQRDGAGPAVDFSVAQFTIVAG